MKATIYALAFASIVSAHTTVYRIVVDGKPQPPGNVQGGYIDTPPSNSPVVDVTSQAMECNVAGIKATTSVAVNGGSNIAVEWHHNSADAGDDIVATSHVGPINVYMSKASSSMSWTKISAETYDGTWPVTKLIKGLYTGTPGQHNFTLPNVVPGDYVIRPEIIALHEGNRVGGAQFYQECIHVKVSGSGTAVLPAGVAIPGYVTANTPGVLFDIYNGFTKYPNPGPEVWNGASGAGTPPPAKSPPPYNVNAAPKPDPVTGPASKPPSNVNAAPNPDPATGPASSTLTTMARPVATPNDGLVQPWGRCGGLGSTGPTTCHSSCQCKKWNDWYSQCV
ncbi:Carbohydrate-binding module family 1 protein [Pyrenophora tritici-repentis]|nr:Carbohydrate-binding module family 1 protein [Pyrenophora tritici-repentis]